MIHLLLIEDDRELREMLCAALQAEGHHVRTAASASEARALLQHTTPDLVLLDLGLPDASGDSVLAELRQRRSTPVLVISAQQADRRKIDLLDAGADDYLTKPFSIGELLARIRVALRHRGTTVTPATTRYHHRGLEVDLSAHRVHLHGQPLHLTPTEFRLLARLVRSTGQVVTHRALLADVWGAEYVEHTHYLRLYMAQLRAKIEANPADPCLLLTEPGVGYRLAEEGVA